MCSGRFFELPNLCRGSENRVKAAQRRKRIVRVMGEESFSKSACAAGTRAVVETGFDG